MNSNQLLNEGYTQGPPPAVETPRGLLDVAAIDGPIVEDSVCPECGHAGMVYKPWHNALRKTYRAFAFCPKCHYSEEF